MPLSLKIDNTKNNIIDKFENDKEYFNALKILINSSSELNNKIKFINDKILPYTKTGSILDIGIGDGEFSKTIYKNFNNVHLVDPSKLALTSIQENEFYNKAIKKFNSKVEDFLFLSNFYDLILNCHTLYHVKRDYWKNIIKKSCRSLKSQGTQLIVINNGLGRSKLTDFFGNYNIINIEKLIEECASIQDINVEVYPFYEKAITKSLREIIQISKIFLQDVNVIVNKDLLIKYLNNNCKKENYFFLDYCQYFITLKKNN